MGINFMKHKILKTHNFYSSVPIRANEDGGEATLWTEEILTTLIERKPAIFKATVKTELVLLEKGVVYF